MTNKLIALRIRATQSRFVAGRDAGQGTLEYVGAILIAAIIIGLVIAGVNAASITTKVTAAVNKILG
jgi:hypothetical protein